MPLSVTELQNMSKRLAKADAERAVLRDIAGQLDRDLVEALLTQEATEEAQVTVQVTAQETQEQLKVHVQDLVQHALESIFPGKYQFRVDIELKNGRTAAEIYLLDQSGRRVDPVYGNGGGLVEVVAFALRVVGWSLSRTQNVILMDEPFSKVSLNLRPAVIELLRDITTRLGLQIIMVTHDEDMMANADRIFTVTQKNGRSVVTSQEGIKE